MWPLLLCWVWAVRAKFICHVIQTAGRSDVSSEFLYISNNLMKYLVITGCKRSFIHNGALWLYLALAPTKTTHQSSFHSYAGVPCKPRGAEWITCWDHEQLVKVRCKHSASCCLIISSGTLHKHHIQAWLAVVSCKLSILLCFISFFRHVMKD